LVERLTVTFLGQLEVHLRLVHALALPPPAGDGGLHARVLACDGLRALGVVPEIGRRGPLAQLAGALLEAGEVKDASRGSRRARRGPGRARAGPRAAWRRRPSCPAPWRPSISDAAARRERACSGRLRHRSRSAYRLLDDQGARVRLAGSRPRDPGAGSRAASWLDLARDGGGRGRLGERLGS